MKNDEWLEDMVRRYLQAKGEEKDHILAKILAYFRESRSMWGREFAHRLPGLDCFPVSTEDGEQVFDLVLLRAMDNFSHAKCLKTPGKAFNAYLVSALLNCLKNLKHWRTAENG